MPAALLTSHFDPAYWQPMKSVGAVAGPEDPLSSFSTGGLMWLFFAGSTRDSIEIEFRPAHFWQRYLGLGALFFVLFHATRAVGVTPMTSALAAMAILAVTVALLTPGLRSLAPRSAVRFSLFYTFLVAVLFWTWPEFPSHWNQAALTGVRL